MPVEEWHVLVASGYFRSRSHIAKILLQVSSAASVS